MADKPIITADYVRSRLTYDPETGVLVWKARPGSDHQTNAWNAKRAGKAAGSPIASGYIEISFQIGDARVRTYAHRVAWLCVHGEWPPHMVDHIDGDPANNRIANLRLATNAENLRNRGAKKTNPSGIKGVSWDKARRKWLAQIVTNGKQSHLGRYDSMDDAAAAYAAAAAKLHGEFSRTK